MQFVPQRGVQPSKVCASGPSLGCDGAPLVISHAANVRVILRFRGRFAASAAGDAACAAERQFSGVRESQSISSCLFFFFGAHGAKCNGASGNFGSLLFIALAGRVVCVVAETNYRPRCWCAPVYCLGRANVQLLTLASSRHMRANVWS